jgi:hypothetical protein
MYDLIDTISRVGHPPSGTSAGRSCAYGCWDTALLFEKHVRARGGLLEQGPLVCHVDHRSFDMAGLLLYQSLHDLRCPTSAVRFVELLRITGDCDQTCLVPCSVMML